MKKLIFALMLLLITLSIVYSGGAESTQFNADDYIDGEEINAALFAERFQVSWAGNPDALAFIEANPVVRQNENFQNEFGWALSHSSRMEDPAVIRILALDNGEMMHNHYIQNALSNPSITTSQQLVELNRASNNHVPASVATRWVGARARAVSSIGDGDARIQAAAQVDNDVTALWMALKDNDFRDTDRDEFSLAVIQQLGQGRALGSDARAVVEEIICKNEELKTIQDSTGKEVEIPITAGCSGAVRADSFIFEFTPSSDVNERSVTLTLDGVVIDISQPGLKGADIQADGRITGLTRQFGEMQTLDENAELGLMDRVIIPSNNRNIPPGEYYVRNIRKIGEHTDYVIESADGRKTTISTDDNLLFGISSIPGIEYQSNIPIEVNIDENKHEFRTARDGASFQIRRINENTAGIRGENVEYVPPEQGFSITPAGFRDRHEIVVNQNEQTLVGLRSSFDINYQIRVPSNALVKPAGGGAMEFSNGVILQKRTDEGAPITFSAHGRVHPNSAVSIPSAEIYEIHTSRGNRELYGELNPDGELNEMRFTRSYLMDGNEVAFSRYESLNGKPQLVTRTTKTRMDTEFVLTGKESPVIAPRLSDRGYLFFGYTGEPGDSDIVFSGDVKGRRVDINERFAGIDYQGERLGNHNRDISINVDGRMTLTSREAITLSDDEAKAHHVLTYLQEPGASGKITIQSDQRGRQDTVEINDGRFSTKSFRGRARDDERDRVNAEMTFVRGTLDDNWDVKEDAPVHVLFNPDRGNNNEFLYVYDNFDALENPDAERPGAIAHSGLSGRELRAATRRYNEAAAIQPSTEQERREVHSDALADAVPAERKSTEQRLRKLRDDNVQNEQKLAELLTEREGLVEDGSSTSQIDAKIASLQAEIRRDNEQRSSVESSTKRPRRRRATREEAEAMARNREEEANANRFSLGRFDAAANARASPQDIERGYDRRQLQLPVDRPVQEMSQEELERNGGRILDAAYRQREVVDANSNWFERNMGALFLGYGHWWGGNSAQRREIRNAETAARNMLTASRMSYDNPRRELYINSANKYMERANFPPPAVMPPKTIPADAELTPNSGDVHGVSPVSSLDVSSSRNPVVFTKQHYEEIWYNSDLVHIFHTIIENVDPQRANLIVYNHIVGDESGSSINIDNPTPQQIRGAEELVRQLQLDIDMRVTGQFDIETWNRIRLHLSSLQANE